ncbi:uncharacterized protein [Nicotiana sylvestris]|uniref:DUF4283 domain-containing protein n=2 Tax=Nicotiana TaxID=4085 RepID=A0A1S4AQ42_TOBAC|nr:PREDICTED: uncharacterized protein LOC104222386 [Nicotiana sylvestris]XP_016478680.1 PREDICTED: uncharacterized protein LOC107800055 [Nicotiana tabacum]
MILKQWEPKFQMSKEKTRNIPIWVIFPSLPVEYWTKENLARIASCIGKPICSDRLTAEGERIFYARMLIEMDISQELPNVMLIEEAEGTYMEQELEYEWRLAFCEVCFQIGKHEVNCEKAPIEKQKYRGEEQDRQAGIKQQKKMQWKVKVTMEQGGTTKVQETTISQDKEMKDQGKEQKEDQNIETQEENFQPQ